MPKMNNEDSRSRITIDVMETINAIENMGKKKATSHDEVMDIIFQKKF